MAAAARVILHADLDAFFASVEQLDDPTLRGRPVLVGGSGRRGVVAAASYEARGFGCRSAQPMSVARRLCPDAVIRPPRMDRYRELSAAVFEIFERVTPLVQPLSIDEAFLDATGSIRLLGPPPEIAGSIRARVRAATGLAVSVGVGPSRFVAKLASELAKPDGLRVIGPDEVLGVLDPLPVTRLWGVGEAAAKRLGRLGLRTLGDVRRADPDVLERTLGELGGHAARLARGEDDRAVVCDREAKSISHEQTFGHDLTDPAAARVVLLQQAEQVARRLRAKGRLTGTVTVKLRYGDFETRTRSKRLAAPTDLTDDIRGVAASLYDAWASSGFRPVRLIGVGAHDLTPAGAAAERQAGLFDAEDTARRRRLDAATDAIAGKHGRHAIRRGSN